MFYPIIGDFLFATFNKIPYPLIIGIKINYFHIQIGACNVNSLPDTVANLPDPATLPFLAKHPDRVNFRATDGLPGTGRVLRVPVMDTLLRLRNVRHPFMHRVKNTLHRRVWSHILPLMHRVNHHQIPPFMHSLRHQVRRCISARVSACMENRTLENVVVDASNKN